MKNKLEQPSLPENNLFQQAMEGVTPISNTNRITPSPPVRRSPISNPASTPALSNSNLSDHGASDIAQTTFLRNGLNNMTLRKLRRGFWPIQDAIDLHGYSTDEARHHLHTFLINALNNGLRCVSIVHGKGWRAEGGEGILKIRVRHWLPQFPQVMAFCEPPANAGGGGAVWVLLKSNGK